MLHKFGELSVLDSSNICSTQSILADSQVEERFKKFANGLKRITPKADEFLYFSCVMLTSAEAAILNHDGSVKLTKTGEPVVAEWEIKGDSWKWKCNDPSILPYKNANFDAFPEQEILKAYKNWIGKPLCVDHKSSSVDAIRGVILDTYYDRKMKRVIGLCALDKLTYPDLANKVSLGYSTCVSMGTGVQVAVCYDCGNAAKTEQDFCSHMRAKSAYCEINVGLQPIELSIVVNGADPQAKIRTIIAAANTINANLANHEQQLSKLSTTEQIEKIEELQDDIRKAGEKVAELKEVLEEKDAVSPPYGQSSGRLNDPSDEVDPGAPQLNLPERLAYNGNNIALENEIKNLQLALETRMHKMEEMIHKLNNKEETHMSKDATMNKQSYFQGGGGVNEPTPGQKKYPVDPTNEKLRLHGDKQMVGESPFPEVGDVDGLHPSPSSVDEKDELERKKMLARAEQENRAMRRQAALQKARENIANQKQGFFQGGGGVNEPTPGERKYPVDPGAAKAREEDKPMVGQKPFPGVGDVDGLHPSPLSVEEKDELKRKEMLARADMQLTRGQFVRVANADGSYDTAKTGWNVYAKNQSGKEVVVFQASVDDITGGKSTEAMFDVVSSKEFGKKILDKIASQASVVDGVKVATAVYKRAQAVAGPGSQPGMPQDVGGPGPAPADMGAPPPAEEKPEDEGGSGDPKETANKLAEKVRDLSSDLLEAVRALTGEQTQMGDMEQGLEELPKTASAHLAPLYRARRSLNRDLIVAGKKAVADLKNCTEELELIASVVDQDTLSSKAYVADVVSESFSEADSKIASAKEYLTAYTQYVRGSVALVKQATSAKSTKDSEDCMMADDANNHYDSTGSNDVVHDDNSADFEDEVDGQDYAVDVDGVEVATFPSKEEAEKWADSFAPDTHWTVREVSANLDDIENELHEDDMMNAQDENATMVELPAGTPVPPGAKAVEQKTASFDLTTKQGRAAYRAKLAYDATGKEDDGEVVAAEKIKFSPMLDQAHRNANGQTRLDVKPSDELGLVETVEEKNKKVLEVARMAPKVRKEAERLNQLVAEGKVAESDLDALISQGLDPEVVKYWRQFYGQIGKEGSEFAKLLTTETMKAKADEEVASHKIKLGRAYELANEMVRRGLVEDDRAAITAQVDQIMTWNDAGFESMKRVVAKQAPLAIRKSAGTVPQVGILSDENVSAPAKLDFVAELDRAFSTKRNGY